MPKPVKKTKKFIDKKRDNVTTFRLVHRSQRDPLATDAEAPQRVLQEVAPSEHDRLRRKEQQKYGVYFDDNYDYLQHLRNKDEEIVEWEEVEKFTLEKEKPVIPMPKSNLKLPSSVFATDFEEDVGILNKAAPRSGPLVGLDDDVLEVMETLDDEYDVTDVTTAEDLAREFGDADLDDDNGAMDEAETELDHVLAEIDQKGLSEDEEDISSDFYGSEADDQMPELDDDRFGDLETRSRFTEYSMSSAVTRRSEYLVNLDERFEKFYEAYDEENTGSLEYDVIEGHLDENSDIMNQLIKEYQEEQAQERVKPDLTELAKVSQQEEEEDGESGSGDEKELIKVEQNEDKWDCQSILSTYSNIYHHPRLISEPSKKNPIKISGKTGMPKDVLGKGLTLGALKQLDRENAALDGGHDIETCTLASRVSQLSIRNKHETLGEKKQRKAAFKEFKRERRLEKKANQTAFKEEKERQEKHIVNNRKNVQGLKLV